MFSDEVSCGSLPVKSNSSSSPRMRRVIATRSGLPLSESSLAYSAKKYSPSGMARTMARACCSE
ncbi:Uncharacterised protein [Bordetella pertussis]|nr:Uncharacterised protein [Bordetella pertussis]CFW30612.1 Uncharacterised protein [Bordetella pertussis]CPM53241.1 Uncharacterised protein [Bordetella pertussis]